MINILIQENYIKKKKYINMIENIKKSKHINVYNFNNKNDIKVLTEKHKLENIITVCHNNLDIKISYTNIISALKNVLKLMPNMKKKMDIFKNICLNIPIILFSSGPSFDINLKKMKEIEDNYLILAVKYSRDILLKNNIFIDFTLQSHFTHKGYKLVNSNEENTISLLIISECWPSSIRTSLHSKSDIIFTPYNNVNWTHDKTFNNLITKKNINIITINDNKIKEKLIVFFKAHIMLEVSIPFSMYIGCKNIFTFGWDGPKNGKYNYASGKELNLPNRISAVNNRIVNNATIKEYGFIKTIDNEIFIKNNINVYKCNEISPIKLRFKDILNN